MGNSKSWEIQPVTRFRGFGGQGQLFDPVAPNREPIINTNIIGATQPGVWKSFFASFPIEFNGFLAIIFPSKSANLPQAQGFWKVF